MKHYVVDLSAVTSWTDFIAAFNEGFVEQVGGSGWNGNLDAFNDYLWWPDEHPYNLVIRGWTACANAVNQHKAPDGQPVLDVVAEIFGHNPQTQLVLAEPTAAPDDGRV